MYPRAILIVLATTLLAEDGLPRQGRDSRPADSGVIAGTLIAADTRLPIRDARVALVGEALRDTLVVTTDENGAFVFSGVPPGRLWIWATKPGFVTTSYGERTAGSGKRGSPIDLSVRQTVERLTFQLPRASVVTGVVTNEFGEAVTGCLVLARRYAMVAGRRTVQILGTAQTDDRGAFRVSSLPVSTSFQRKRAFSTALPPPPRLPTTPSDRHRPYSAFGQIPRLQVATGLRTIPACPREPARPR